MTYAVLDPDLQLQGESTLQNSFWPFHSYYQHASAFGKKIGEEVMGLGVQLPCSES